MLSPTPWPSPTWLPLVSASLRVSKIASFGHSGRQAPQEIHSSVISSAMTLASFSLRELQTGLTRLQRHDIMRGVIRRHSSLPLFFKSTERRRIRRPRFAVIMGLWAQIASRPDIDFHHGPASASRQEEADHHDGLAGHLAHECVDVSRAAGRCENHYHRISKWGRDRGGSDRYAGEAPLRYGVSGCVASERRNDLYLRINRVPPCDDKGVPVPH